MSSSYLYLLRTVAVGTLLGICKYVPTEHPLGRGPSWPKSWPKGQHYYRTPPQTPGQAIPPTPLSSQSSNDLQSNTARPFNTYDDGDDVFVFGVLTDLWP
jgi:hypothetical protein